MILPRANFVSNIEDLTFDARDVLEDPELELKRGRELDAGLDMDTDGLELDVDEELDDVPKLIWPRTE